MGHSSIGRSRALGVVTAALAFATYLMISAVPAQAAVTCDYDAVHRQVTLESTAAEPLQLTVGAGGAIFFDDNTDDADGDPCQTATVNNTDGITVLPGANVELDLSGGPFAPGETPEANGESEIEFDVDGTVHGGNNLDVEGSSGNDSIVVGNGLNAPTGSIVMAGAINWDGDGDPDVTFAENGNGANDLDVYGNNVDDTISVNGGSGTGAFLEQDSPDLFGGDEIPDSGTNADDGDDLLTGSDFITVDGDDMEGDEGNDILNGGAGDDTVADQGDVDDDLTCDTDELDTLVGGPGIDALGGGDGRDLLDGGLDNDNENGGNCNDTFDQGTGPNGSDVLNGDNDEGGDMSDCGPDHRDLVDYGQRNSDLFVDIDAGGTNDGEVGANEDDDVTFSTESVIGGTGDDELIGDGDGNFLAGGPGDDTIMALADDDCVQPGAGDDDADGGLPTGSDMVDYSDAPNGVTVDLAAGTATGHGTDTLNEFEDVNGSAFNDTLLGDDLDNELFGGEGNDTMDARDGEDFYDGAGGNDAISDTGDSIDEDDDINGGEGDDTIDAGSGNDSVHGDDDDLETPDDGDDTIESGEGDDDVDGEGGDDAVTDSGLSDATDNDDDELEGGDGNDTISSDQGDDAFMGDEIEDTEVDGAGNDVATPGAGDDEFYMGAGNDTVTDTGLDDDVTTSSDDAVAGDPGNDVVHAGEGDDCIGALGCIPDDGDPGIDDGDLPDSDPAAGDDQLFGEAGDDDIFGGQDDDVAEGGDGDDFIEGNDDTDTLRGDAGEDEIEGDDGADKVEGGTGDDTLDGDGGGTSGPDTLVYAHLVDSNGDGHGQDVDMSQGFAEGDDGNDVIDNFEKAKGSKFDDSIKGGETGGGGGVNFNLAGGKGDDVLTGSTSNDTLKGSGGNDLMIGLGGADQLKGGKGKDEGDGGKGKDLCFAVEVRHSCDKA